MSGCERERKRKRGLHMAPTLLPTFTTTTTNDRGREGAKGRRQDTRHRKAYVVPVSIRQSAQSISTITAHWSKNSRPSLSHPIQHPKPLYPMLHGFPPVKTANSCATHLHTLHTPYHFSFSIITICCNEANRSHRRPVGATMPNRGEEAGFPRGL